MRHANRHRCIAFVASTAALASGVRADGLSGLYLGGNFGREQNTYDTAFVDDPVRSGVEAAGDTLKLQSSSVRRTDNAWWVDGGYMLRPYLGIDASFLHLGELTHRASGTVRSPTDASIDYPLIATATVVSHGPALSLLARLPLAESFDIDLRLGDYYAKTVLTSGVDLKSKYDATSQSASGSSLLAGVGAVYTFAWHWSVRLDYLRVNHAGDRTVGNYNVNVASAGATFTF